MTDILKPCPFCGNKEIIDDEDEGITCPNCGSYIDRISVEDDVSLVDVWNTRPIEDKKDEEIKHLRESLEEIQDAITLLNTADVLEHISDKIKQTLKGGEE